MDLFKLIGSIIIKKDDADAAISDVSTKGQNLASTIGTAFQNVGNKMTSVGKAIAPVSLAVGGALTASTKSASDFQNSIAKVSTLVDTSKVSVSDLSKTFLDLSNETGKSATELAEAGYQALSASVPIENLGEFTRTATNLAKVGFTQASTAVDVMTTAINAYGLESSDANKIANNLVKTQNLGKTTVDELASSMGKIIPTASSMNVNLDNLSAVYVSLTKQGIATAEATTYANSMFNELGDSGTDVGKILKEKTGKSFQELMASGYSVADCLKILQDDAKESGTNFNELWGSSEAGKAAIALLNNGVDEFNGTVETMADNTDVVAEGLEKLDTPSAKAQKAINRIKNSGIELGTSFLTALTPTIEKVCGVVEKATTWFNNLNPKVKTVIATVMGIVAVASPVLMIGGKILSGVGSFITKLPQLVNTVKMVANGFKALFSVLMANPIVLIIAAIAALVAAFIYLWNTNENFRNFWINLWNNIKNVVTTVVNAVKTFLTNAWNAIKTTVETVFTAIATFFSTIWNAISTTVSTVWETIKNVVQVAIMFIVEIVKLAFNLITLPWRFIWENCKDTILTIWNAIKTAVSTAINAIKTVITTVLNAVKTFITTVMNAIKTVFSTVWNAIKSVITTVLNAIKAVVTSVWNAIKSVVTSVINAIKSVITSVFNAIKSTITSILNSVKSTFTSVWNSIKSTVTSAVNGVKSTISSGLNAAKSTVTSVLNAIKSKFTSIFNTVKSTVQNAINKVKSIMHFSWSLPRLKLPHISISGRFSINPPSVPHFGISWYKKAMDNPMLFTEPTLFDLNPNTGVGKVAGEAGDEMMYGRTNLMDDIATVVAEKNRDLTDKFDRLISILVEFFPELMTAMNRQIVLDSGAVVGELAPAMDAELGRIIDHKGRGN